MKPGGNGKHLYNRPGKLELEKMMIKIIPDLKNFIGNGEWIRATDKVKLNKGNKGRTIVHLGSAANKEQDHSSYLGSTGKTALT